MGCWLRQALQEACEALGAARVIQLAPASQSQRVVDAARRLALHAPSLRAGSSLAGTGQPFWCIVL